MSLKHGMCGRKNRHAIYATWVSFKQRCLNPKNTGYKDYGARGIRVCDRWLDFKNFYDDMFPTWVKGLQLDRKDNDGHYSPDNCVWSTPSQNSKNRRMKSIYQSDIDYVCYDKYKSAWLVIRRFNTKEDAEMHAKSFKENS